MNISNPLQPSPRFKTPKLLNVAFNQDYSCFAVCTEIGFKVYATYPMELKMERDFTSSRKRKQSIDNNDHKFNGFMKNDELNEFSGIGIVKMLYKTNYIALVGGGKRPKFPVNKVYIWDDLKQKESIVLEFNTPVLNVHLSRKHIVVILQNLSLVFSFKLKPELLYSFETANNENGISDMVVYENASMFVFPGRVAGQLHIIDINNTSTVMVSKDNNNNINENSDNDNNNDFTFIPGERDNDRKSIGLIKAHKNPIQCVCLSTNGTMVASASNQGTIIRIHDTKTCSLLYEFRRGVDSATITNMKFSPNNEKLAVLSDKHTLHIYYIEKNEELNVNKTHFLKSIPLFTNYFRSTWSYVSKDVRHKNDNVHDVGELGWVDDNSVVIVWKFKGIWEKYEIVMNTMYFENNNEGNKWKIVKEGWRSV